MIEITTARTTLRVLGPEWSDSLLRYRIRNREHLAPWEPTRDHTYYTAASSKERLEKDCEGFTRGQSICLWGVDTTASDVIGSCNFTNIVWGPFQACHLGFSVDADYQGKGYMREMVEAAIDHVFGTVGLHRIMANHMPSNIRSAKLLEGLGFEKEGFAKSYLQINGRWEDHILTAKVNPDHRT
tara:strand:- start:1736 stop:2287 length:552 start_codon:yes stop_codon:yes gene_type:complete